MPNKSFHINAELYKQGAFDKISFNDKYQNCLFKLHPKQVEALECFSDGFITSLGYGGAARGGKSALIALSSLFECFAYPQSRYLLGRKNLMIFWQTTGKSLFRMLDIFDFEAKKDFTFNQVKNEIVFHANKSELLIKNLELQPSDPDATAFGSLEITKAYIDQSEHVDIRIIDKIRERVGTHMALKYDIKGKVMECFNPSRSSHTKHRFWFPYRDGNEKQTVKFIRALPSDNPSPEAKKWLDERIADYNDGTMSESDYQMQVKGNFDFESGDDIIFTYEKLQSIFTNEYIKGEGKNYGSCDTAASGQDATVAFKLTRTSNGYYFKILATESSSTHDSIVLMLKEQANKEEISLSNCVVDAGGQATVHSSIGAIGFKGGSRPNKSYSHLKAQCAKKLSDLIAKDLVYFECDNSTIKDTIIRELQAFQRRKMDNEQGVYYITTKDEIKRNLGGKSPNYADAMIMAMVFFIEGATQPLYYPSCQSVISSNTIDGKQRHAIKLNENSKCYVLDYTIGANHIHITSEHIYERLEEIKTEHKYYVFKGERNNDKAQRLRQAKNKFIATRKADLMQSSEYNYRRQVKVIEIISKMFKGAHPWKLTIDPNCVELIKGLNNTIKREDNYKNEKSSLTDLFDYLLIQIFVK